VAALAFALLAKEQATSNLYFFISVCLYVQIPGAIDFWYTADPSCVADGPHFDFTYYQTVSQLVGNVAQVAGIVLFQLCVRNWRFRTAFWVTTVVRIVASCVDLLIIQRVNVRFGLPDKAAFILGDAMILNLAQMLDLMPAILLTSRLTSPAMATTSFAVLAGFFNFGMNASRALGTFMIDWFGVKTAESHTGVGASAEECDFSNLSWLVLVAHIILPALSIPLAFFLIPDLPINGPLETQHASASRQLSASSLADEDTMAGGGLDETDDQYTDEESTTAAAAAAVAGKRTSDEPTARQNEQHHETAPTVLAIEMEEMALRVPMGLCVGSSSVMPRTPRMATEEGGDRGAGD